MKLNNNIFLTLAFLMASLMVKAQTIPAQSMVSVSVKETKKIQDGSGVIDEVRIYDSYGGLQKRLQHFGTKRADFNISGIPSGRYLIEIRSGKYKEYQQLIIQK